MTKTDCIQALQMVTLAAVELKDNEFKFIADEKGDKESVSLSDIALQYGESLSKDAKQLIPEIAAYVEGEIDKYGEVKHDVN